MSARPAPASTDTPAFDPRRRFVRVTGTNRRGFVEFEFSIGVPELRVELMLPAAAFAQFCRAQNAVRLDARGDLVHCGNQP